MASGLGVCTRACHLMAHVEFSVGSPGGAGLSGHGVPGGLGRPAGLHGGAPRGQFGKFPAPRVKNTRSQVCWQALRARRAQQSRNNLKKLVLTFHIKIFYINHSNFIFFYTMNAYLAGEGASHCCGVRGGGGAIPDVPAPAVGTFGKALPGCGRPPAPLRPKRPSRPEPPAGPALACHCVPAPAPRPPACRPCSRRWPAPGPPAPAAAAAPAAPAPPSRSPAWPMPAAVPHCQTAKGKNGAWVTWAPLRRR